MTVLTGCTVTKVLPVDRSYEQALAEMIPSVPEVPPFPELSWSYQDGLYSIGEDDVDRLLDYGENQMPAFRWELEKYRETVEVIRKAIIEGPASSE